MNSIRWMPMIRWLKFPFRVHILHKTVQLSVHEPRGRMCLKPCPTLPPSPGEQRGRHAFGSSTVFYVFFFFSYKMSRTWSEVSSVFCVALFFVFLIQSFVIPYSWHLLSGGGKTFSTQFSPNSGIFFNDHSDTNSFLSVKKKKRKSKNRKPQQPIVKKKKTSIQIPMQHIIFIPCQWCSIIPHCERVSNFSLCESESEQGSYSPPDNCQNNSR